MVGCTRLSLARLGISFNPSGPSTPLVLRRLSSTAPPTDSLGPRWLSDIKQRLGKCMTFGTDTEQTQRAGRILSEIALDWRALIAGSEGFLTGPERRGLYRQAVVWGEQDSMGHVNNVMYNRYAESGRIEWAQKLARLDPANSKAWTTLFAPTEAGFILRTITTSFKFPMTWPDRISVYHKLHHAPTSGSDAIVLDVLVMSEKHQRPAARLSEDILVYDYTRAKKIALPAFMYDMFSSTWILQEQARKENTEKGARISAEVRRLERETWDGDGAVERVGSPGP
ncbi:hypothetical protein LTR62_001277 [Meristemomyces frigidus]|uniref:Thioesterase/thiol ester dehydrase-isomerase n=1 Tax=Meristemomyces frigidus TaxID=1508187 RepID=A0AAN7YMG9_9PEZI|nr:hypothetical protein LTR62_001277 [Meristemomyces frigidus]